MKTATSETPLPLAQEIVEALLIWRSQASFVDWNDFVFASDRRTHKHPHAGGPRGNTSILGHHIKPAAVRAGVVGKIGWHTLRHTYATVLEQVGVRMKVAQELLRYADIQTTVSVYTGAMEKAKQQAIELVARRMLKRTLAGNSESGPETVN